MLHLHRAERADRLADALAQILVEAPDDPFVAEVVAVPTRGMERWLTQRLSLRLGARPGREDGVCANVEFPFPGRLIGGALAAASGIDPAADPWLPERMVWALLEVIEGCQEEPWLAPLARHLAKAPERRFGRVRQIAHLFDEYGVRRPALIQAWARDEDPESGSPTPDWQPELWRRLRERIGAPSGAERLPAACRRLRDDPALAPLPGRLALFGLTRLPASYLDALRALAAGRDVHLMLLHPSPVLWDEVRAAAPRLRALPRRAQDPTATLPANRLLASWGRDSRELQLVLLAGGDSADRHLDTGEAPAGTLLAAIQADIRADQPPPGAPLPGQADRRRPVGPGDTSLRVHACHGQARQVEVLREAILHLLADDPTLEPRDVIVMCPDIETYAPLIQATFGTGHPATDDAETDLGELAPTDLRVRLADRSLRQTNPVLGALARMLELAAQRLTASQVLDLADSEPIRRRFNFDDEDLARIQDWVRDAGIHWGLDAEHRRAYRLDAVQAGTWSAGLRRLMLGVSLSESGRRLYERVLPIDDVESGRIELAGRFAEFLDRLRVALDRLSGAHPVAAWARALGDAADALTQSAGRDAWQRQELARLLDAVVAEATGAPTATLALPEIRALIGHRLEGRPTRANFRTGHLTVCTLVPMRSVPHRVVCLLGLDDGAFPRRSPRDGDNRLLDDPHVGDRDPRSEDRQLLLDALLAARERLIITYSGNDERTNAPRPAAVPVGELLDAVDATARHAADPGRPAREAVLVRHPLQPFDPRNFRPGALLPGRPWSFDGVALEGAEALGGRRREREPFLPSPLPPAPDGALALNDLIAFAERPVRAFLRQRLGISVATYDNEVQDELPVQLDGLALWGVGQRLLEGVLAGAQPRDCALAEIARGTLPPGALGEPVIRDQVWPALEPILRHARTHAGSAPARSLETNLRLAGGARLTGTVSGVRDHVLLAVSYSRLSARHRLATWVRLLALNAAHPDVAFEAITVGRARRRGDGVSVARIPPLARDPQDRRTLALTELAALAELRARGLREPLPLPCLAAAAYAEAMLRGGNLETALAAAEEEWLSPWAFDKEDREPDHVLAFGGQLSLEELVADARFGRLALALWEPLLTRETVDDL